MGDKADAIREAKRQQMQAQYYMGSSSKIEDVRAPTEDLDTISKQVSTLRDQLSGFTIDPTADPTGLMRELHRAQTSTRSTIDDVNDIIAQQRADNSRRWKQVMDEADGPAVQSELEAMLVRGDMSFYDGGVERIGVPVGTIHAMMKALEAARQITNEATGAPQLTFEQYEKLVTNVHKLYNGGHGSNMPAAYRQPTPVGGRMYVTEIIAMALAQLKMLPS